MKSKVIWGISLFFLSLFIQQVNAKTAKEIYRDYKDSVVLISVEEENGSASTGTAFAIDNEGTFLTAAHVIFSSKELKAINYDNKTFKIKSILWMDKDSDLAIIKVSNAEVFKPIPLISYKTLEVGEKLTVISYPRGEEVGGFESTLAEGLLSSIREKFITERIEEENPIYDKSSPIVYKAVAFFKKFQADCKPTENNKAFKCSDGRLAVMDKNNILYDNFDIAIKEGKSVYYFANQNKALTNPVKLIGPMLQYTTPISPGSSGGPIFNEKGEVVAVVNSFLDNAQNINFGRPIDYLPQEFLKKNQMAFQQDHENIRSIQTVYAK